MCHTMFIEMAWTNRFARLGHKHSLSLITALNCKNHTFSTKQPSSLEYSDSGPRSTKYPLTADRGRQIAAGTLTGPLSAESPAGRTAPLEYTSLQPVVRPLHQPRLTCTLGRIGTKYHSYVCTESPVQPGHVTTPLSLATSPDA